MICIRLWLYLCCLYCSIKKPLSYDKGSNQDQNQDLGTVGKKIAVQLSVSFFCRLGIFPHSLNSSTVHHSILSKVLIGKYGDGRTYILVYTYMRKGSPSPFLYDRISSKQRTAVWVVRLGSDWEGCVEIA